MFGSRSRHSAAHPKFYVVNDATQNLTYEYTTGGQSIETYSLNTGNPAPRGAASTVAGDKTWVVDANRKVYVYNNSGTLLGSWTAGTLSTKAASWRALPPTVPTSGSWMPTAIRSTSTPVARDASPVLGLRKAVSA